MTDQGIGIAPHDVDRIFERFYRADQARSRSTGGTGLGLAIVKHIATNHGGSVDVWSVEGSGSTFTLRLPDPGCDSPGFEDFDALEDIDSLAEFSGGEPEANRPADLEPAVTPTAAVDTDRPEPETALPAGDPRSGPAGRENFDADAERRADAPDTASADDSRGAEPRAERPTAVTRGEA